MQDQQAYRTTGAPADGNDEWNRINAAVRSVLNGMATMTLARVESVTGRTVSLVPIVAQTDGAGNAVPHGTIHNAPVWRYQAGGVAVVVDPVVGDVGLALFAHSDISTAKATGTDSPAGSKRRFDWGDAVYLGGLFGGAPTSTVTLSAAGGVVITSDQPVTINADAVVNGTVTATGDVSTTGRLTAATATIGGVEFASHVHTGVTVGTGVSGPVSPA